MSAEDECHYPHLRGETCPGCAPLSAHEQARRLAKTTHYSLDEWIAVVELLGDTAEVVLAASPGSPATALAIAELAEQK